jgi:ubiquinone/menaquinone biosynthesis C-methylase UbiE
MKKAEGRIPEGTPLKQETIILFNSIAEAYGDVEFFKLFAERLVAWSHLTEGQVVLDVATGRGALAFAAAAAVGLSGRVEAIDAAQRMVALTREAAESRGLANLQVQHMAAEHLMFKDEEFDVALCGFALHIVSTPGDVLTEIHRVLKPGGTLVASVPGPVASNRWKFTRIWSPNTHLKQPTVPYQNESTILLN